MVMLMWVSLMSGTDDEAVPSRLRISVRDGNYMCVKVSDRMLAKMRSDLRAFDFIKESVDV